MGKIEVVLSDERLITSSGLCMVGQAMAKSDLIKKAARMRTDKRSQPQIKNGDILLTEIGMLTLGKTDFDYVNEFHKDEEYYKMSLGIAYGIPSESTLRMRLDAIGQSMNGEILSGNISLFKACHVQPTALTNGMVPLDIDVTPFDNSKSHKEGVSRTYKILMAMLQLWHISEQRDMAVILNCGKAVSIVKMVHRFFSGKPLQQQNR